MRTVTQLTNYRFLNIKQVVDEENHVNKYQFAERLGVDSIAFVCYDKNRKIVLLNEELKPPIGLMILSAFGGSLDKEKPLFTIVQEEVREEAGFDVDKENIIDMGKVFVSTQMNQWCHLYLVYVNKDDQKERKPENKIEAMARTVWLSTKNLVDIFVTLQDWKSITILAKADKEGLL